MDRCKLGDFFVNQILEWTQSNYRCFPWRKEDVGIYESLIAELMLRRTTSKQVESVYFEFVETFSSPDILEQASLIQLESLLMPLGLKSQRSVALKKIASFLVQQGIPTSLDEIKTLPHVGTYISNAVGCFSLGLRVPIIDSNVIRIFSRFFGVSSIPDNRRNKDIQLLANEILPQNEYVSYNYGLLDFGAIVCVKNPNCSECMLSQFCHYLKQKDQ